MLCWIAFLCYMILPISNTNIIREKFDKFAKVYDFELQYQTTSDNNPYLVHHGVTGKIYLALHKKTNVLCAVKIFHGFVDVDSFYSEAKFWDLLSSAKVPVPKFYGIVWSENEPRKALVSAFVGTRHNTQFSTNTMASMFQNNKTSTMQWLQLLIDISEILVKIHSLGLVHGDLKTDNILISETENNDTVKRNRTEKTPLVVDFGQTTWSNDSYFYKLTTSVASKLQQDYTYIAPELLNSSLFTFASDVYALGDIMRITSKFLAAKRRTKLTNSLLGLSRQCMKKEPHNRPTSFETRRKLVGFL